jgi:hypothetical protein
LFYFHTHIRSTSTTLSIYPPLSYCYPTPEKTCFTFLSFIFFKCIYIVRGCVILVLFHTCIYTLTRLTPLFLTLSVALLPYYLTAFNAFHYTIFIHRTSWTFLNYIRCSRDDLALATVPVMAWPVGIQGMALWTDPEQSPWIPRGDSLLVGVATPNAFPSHVNTRKNIQALTRTIRRFSPCLYCVFPNAPYPASPLMGCLVWQLSVLSHLRLGMSHSLCWWKCFRAQGLHTGPGCVCDKAHRFEQEVAYTPNASVLPGANNGTHLVGFLWGFQQLGPVQLKQVLSRWQLFSLAYLETPSLAILNRAFTHIKKKTSAG